MSSWLKRAATPVQTAASSERSRRLARTRARSHRHRLTCLLVLFVGGHRWLGGRGGRPTHQQQTEAKSTRDGRHTPPTASISRVSSPSKGLQHNLNSPLSLLPRGEEGLAAINGRNATSTTAEAARPQSPACASFSAWFNPTASAPRARLVGLSRARTHLPPPSQSMESMGVRSASRRRLASNSQALLPRREASSDMALGRRVQVDSTRARRRCCGSVPCHPARAAGWQSRPFAPINTSDAHDSPIDRPPPTPKFAEPGRHDKGQGGRPWRELDSRARGRARRRTSNPHGARGSSRQTWRTESGADGRTIVSIPRQPRPSPRWQPVRVDLDQGSSRRAAAASQGGKPAVCGAGVYRSDCQGGVGEGATSVAHAN